MRTLLAVLFLILWGTQSRSIVLLLLLLLLQDNKMISTLPVDRWSVDEVAVWLESIGLGHKAAEAKSKGLTGRKLSDASALSTYYGFSGLQARKITTRLAELKPPIASASPAAAATSTASSNEVAELKRQVAILQAQMKTLMNTPARQPTSVVTATKTTTTYSPTMEYPSIAVPGFCQACRIIGQQPTQILEITMGVGDQVVAEPGSMMHRSSYIHMEARTGGQGFERWITGQRIFVANYTYRGPVGTADTLVLTPDVSGQIIPIHMREVRDYLICQRGSLLCSSPSIQIDIEFAPSLGTGLVGGEGFVLQGLRGPADGMAFLTARGFIQKLKLETNEVRWVSTGCIVAFESTVRYQITDGGASLGTRLVGGEGFFMAELIGPGTVWLESFDMNQLMRRVKVALAKHA